MLLHHFSSFDTTPQPNLVLLRKERRMSLLNRFLPDRSLKWFALIGLSVAMIGGCSKKKATEVADSNTQSDQESAPSKDSESTQPEQKNGLAENLFELMKKAESQNSTGEYDAAFATWKTIHKEVADEYGVDGWQTVSAELAMSAARQRTKMSTDDQKLVAQLTQLTGSAAQAIDKQNYNAARLDIEKAAGISTRLWGKESYVSANINYIRAQCYLGLGLHGRAIAVLNDVLSLRISLTGLFHPDVESTLELLAKSNSILRNHASAQQSLEKLVEVSRTLWGKESEAYANRCNDLAVAYNNDQKAALAMQWFNKAHAIRSKLFGNESLQVGLVHLNRGIAHVQLKEFEKAQQDLAKAHAIFKDKKLNSIDGSWAVLLDQLGTVALVRKQNSDGQKYFSELADYWKAKEGETHIEYGKSLFKLSVSIGNQAKYSEAEPIMKRAISIFENKLGFNSKMLHQPLTTYARLLEKMGVEQQAKQIRDRAVRLAGFQELPE